MKNVYIAGVIGAFLLGLCLYSAKSFAGIPIKVVVIDAGHGGHDPGAVGANGTQEKDIALKMALLLGDMIKEKYPEIKVVYTRKTDVFVELYRRAKIANEHRASLFISIHCNAADNRSVYGTETFIMGLDKANQNIAIAQLENASILSEKNYEANYGGFNPSSPEAYIIFDLYQNKYLYESANFAADIQYQFKHKLNRHCRDVKQAPFLVLWRTAMPSVLVELGFISNKEEEVYLASEKGQQELATALFNAFSKQVEEGKNIKTAEVKTAENPTTQEVVEKDSAILKSEVIYKVQFLVSSKEYPLTDPLFKNMQDISIEKVENIYKYASGQCCTYADASVWFAKVKKMGYKDAFIVAFKKDGTKISIQEAKELENKK